MTKKHSLTTTFLAYLPDIPSAIKIGSDGMRIQLELPESEKSKGIPIIGMTHKLLEITIRELSKEENQSKTLTDFDNETKKSTKRIGITRNSGRSKLNRDQR
jgi:hypothetical protein